MSCVWLFASPWTVAHQAPLSMGFSRQEYWSGLPFPPPRDLPDPGIRLFMIGRWMGRRILYHWATRRALELSHACTRVKLLQPCSTLCDSMDGSLPGSSVHGILHQECWTGLPCPPLGDLCNPGIEPASLMSPALAGGFFTASATWEAGVQKQTVKFSKIVWVV